MPPSRRLRLEAAPVIDLNEVGAHVDGAGNVRFGVYLPQITAAKGYTVVVRVIHDADQFTPEIPPRDFPLTFDPNHTLGRWSATVNVPSQAGGAGHFGAPGRYLYRYRLLQQQGAGQRVVTSLPAARPSAAAAAVQQQGAGQRVVTSLFTDPFAREAGPAKLAAFRLDDPAHPAPAFPFTDAAYRTPPLDDLVVYELQVEEFNSTFDGVAARLDYLEGLGVNCLELMPVTDAPMIFDWGYGPLHFFAPEARWGGPAGLKRLVDACHARGMAVILDVVYQHVSADFAYCRVYADSGETGPMGDFPNGPFGPVVTFQGCPFTQDYFRTANRHWLEEYHVDGFRYDDAKGYYSGPTGPDYADVVYQTYQDSLTIPRFADAAGYRRIIQCAEFIDAHPEIILQQTYSNCTWQDNLLNKAADMAQWSYVDDVFAHLLDPPFVGYPDSRDFNGVPGPTAPFQYIDSHDHSCFVSNFGLAAANAGDFPLGDRGQYFRLQPYAIALYTCQGIPMLWQGQEFAENYVLTGSGSSRIQVRRSMHWEYFYDDQGQALIRVYRRLGRLRRACRALRGRQTFYYNQNSDLTGRAIAYSRRAPASGAAPEEAAVVFLNFSDVERTLSVPFPVAGVYREMLDDDVRASHLDLTVVNAGDVHAATIPANYGQVFVTPPPSGV
ncbi:MAG TPA: alpha-amylase family glycosyl hydrolase [Gemmataceae bacterium]|nr:alpha-amylase family glycosyl hydrolase [Gemmataceae bacterium]